MPRLIPPIYPYDPDAEGLDASVLRAQLINSDGTPHGPPIETGFSSKTDVQNEIIPDEFVWNGILPDDFITGSVDFVTNTARLLGSVTFTGDFEIIVPPLPTIDPSQIADWRFYADKEAHLVTSSDLHTVFVVAERINGGFLTSEEIGAIGVEIAFSPTNTQPSADSELWKSLTVSSFRYSYPRAVATIRIGQGGEALQAGTYYRFVRVKGTLHEVETLPPLVVR